MARWLNLALQPTKTGESVFFDSESGLKGIEDIYCWVCPVLVLGLERIRGFGAAMCIEK